MTHQFRNNAPYQLGRCYETRTMPLSLSNKVLLKEKVGGGGGADQCVTGRKDFCHSVMSTFMSQAREILDSIVFNNLFPQQECECPTYSFLQATTPCPRMDQEG